MFKRTYKRNISLLAGLEFTSYFGITSFGFSFYSKWSFFASDWFIREYLSWDQSLVRDPIWYVS